MVFHVDYQMGVAHARVRVFSAPTATQTFANLGELTMSHADWHAFAVLLVRAGGVVRPDGSIRVTAA